MVHGYLIPCLSGERVKNTRLILIEYIDGGVKKELRIQQLIAPKWKKLAPFLGFGGEEIETIEQSKFYQGELCTDSMMQTWMTRDPNCTWRNLILNMKKAQLVNPAEDLAKALRNIVQ